MNGTGMVMYGNHWKFYDFNYIFFEEILKSMGSFPKATKIVLKEKLTDSNEN